jgi:hypothetical protein
MEQDCIWVGDIGQRCLDAYRVVSASEVSVSVDALLSFMVYPIAILVGLQLAGMIWRIWRDSAPLFPEPEPKSTPPPARPAAYEGKTVNLRKYKVPTLIIRDDKGLPPVDHAALPFCPYCSRTESADAEYCPVCGWSLIRPRSN